MSLYYHLDGRDDILEGLVELAIAEITIHTAGAAWKDGLRILLKSERQSNKALFKRLGARGLRAVKPYSTAVRLMAAQQRGDELRQREIQRGESALDLPSAPSSSDRVCRLRN